LDSILPTGPPSGFSLFSRTIIDTYDTVVR
jgi:hypothetical protein